MRFYPAGEAITRRLPGFPPEHSEWIITGAETGDMIAADRKLQRLPENRS